MKTLPVLMRERSKLVRDVEAEIDECQAFVERVASTRDDAPDDAAYATADRLHAEALDRLDELYEIERELTATGAAVLTNKE